MPKRCYWHGLRGLEPRAGGSVAGPWSCHEVPWAPSTPCCSTSWSHLEPLIFMDFYGFLGVNDRSWVQNHFDLGSRFGTWWKLIGAKNGMCACGNLRFQLVITKGRGGSSAASTLLARCWQKALWCAESVVPNAEAGMMGWLNGETNHTKLERVGKSIGHRGSSHQIWGVSCTCWVKPSQWT